MGRKNKYDELDIADRLDLVEGWKRDGLSDEQISKNLGVSYQTLKEWKKKYPAFLAAIKKGKEVSDYELENVLHRRATGYYYTEETVTNKGDVVTVEKYEHPNPTSLIFALKNRLPEKYSDKQNVEHSGTVTNQNIDMSSISTEELKRLANLDHSTEEDDR
ncbi:helix-turn-helix domain-containing protein [Alkalicoccus chagannorensis]|uniref:helix-turn-helix domain-containing protein n=1 Tax=Alkalicoccus chagannorensis TaxID=427072 RepID=UPI000421A7EC|nr:helix-turn-helix domain-containing protein [Alkalicoccus chagannorensis]